MELFKVESRHSNVETWIDGNFYMSNDLDGLKSNIRTKLGQKENLTDNEYKIWLELREEYDEMHSHHEDYTDQQREWDLTIEKHD